MLTVEQAVKSIEQYVADEVEAGTPDRLITKRLIPLLHVAFPNDGFTSTEIRAGVLVGMCTVLEWMYAQEMLE